VETLKLGLILMRQIDLSVYKLRLFNVPLLRCKNNERRSVVSAFKKLFPWTFDVKFQGGISLGSRKFVGHLNRGSCLMLLIDDTDVTRYY